MNIEELKNKVNNLTNNEYEILSDNYINNKTKIKFKHKCSKCNNHTFEMSSNDFINHNYRCPKCKIINKTKTTNDFYKEVKEKFGKDFELLSKYKNNATSVKIKHLKCGYEFDFLPRRINTRNYCPNCNKKEKLLKRSYNHLKTTDEFKKEVYDLEKEEYIVLTEYINCHTKIKFKHKKCNTEFITEPNNFLKGTRCPYCKRSIAEEKTAKWLKNNKFNFEWHSHFKDCKFKNELEFDFKIFINNSFILLETDGEFHYKPIFGEENLKQQKNRDKIKNDYCKKNNIKLIRIPYTKFANIENELEILLKPYRNLDVV